MPDFFKLHFAGLNMAHVTGVLLPLVTNSTGINNVRVTAVFNVFPRGNRRVVF
jgi:hypothetical protein